MKRLHQKNPHPVWWFLSSMGQGKGAMIRYLVKNPRTPHPLITLVGFLTVFITYPLLQPGWSSWGSRPFQGVQLVLICGPLWPLHLALPWGSAAIFSCLALKSVVCLLCQGKRKEEGPFSEILLYARYCTNNPFSLSNHPKMRNYHLCFSKRKGNDSREVHLMMFLRWRLRWRWICTWFQIPPDACHSCGPLSS